MTVVPSGIPAGPQILIPVPQPDTLARVKLPKLTVPAAAGTTLLKLALVFGTNGPTSPAKAPANTVPRIKVFELAKL